MDFLRRHKADLRAILALALLPVLWYSPALLAPWTGLTILPYDTLAVAAPWRDLYPEIVPHNHAVADAILHHNAWHYLLHGYVRSGTIPLWNPHLLTGVPFLAGGEAGLLYPLSLLLLLGEPDVAYAAYAAMHGSLAGIGMYVLGRSLGFHPWAAVTAGLSWAFGGYVATHGAFPTVLAVAAWLPWLLAMAEVILGKQEAKGTVSFRPIPYLLVGAVAIAMSAMAGNPELLLYTVVFCTGYILLRLMGLYLNLVRDMRAVSLTTVEFQSVEPPEPLGWWQPTALHRVVKQSLWLALMLVLGLGMAAVQIIPFAENWLFSFRDTTATFQQVSDLAWPKRQLLTLWIPNAFGNPTHHQWFDIWNLRWADAPLHRFGRDTQSFDFGLRNYSVGSTYVGLLLWPLTVLARVGRAASPRAHGHPTPHAWVLPGGWVSGPLLHTRASDLPGAACAASLEHRPVRLQLDPRLQLLPDARGSNRVSGPDQQLHGPPPAVGSAGHWSLVPWHRSHVPNPVCGGMGKPRFPGTTGRAPVPAQRIHAPCV